MFAYNGHLVYPIFVMITMSMEKTILLKYKKGACLQKNKKIFEIELLICECGNNI
jgi:hypothetical protein